MIKFYVLLLILFSVYTSQENKQIALTFDDAPRSGEYFSVQERTDKLLKALDDSGAGQVMFFVTTKRLNEQTTPILDQYVKKNHLIANHSENHLWLHKTDIATYKNDFLTAHAKLKDYKTFKPFFRFPYLDEGRSTALNQQMDQFLIEQSYQNGYVTVDNYDWYLNKLYQDAMKNNQSVDMKQLKSLYVYVLLQAIEFSDAYAIKYLGRSPKHVLLLHDNDLAAMFIDDLVVALRAKNWEIISPISAYQDPIAEITPKTRFRGQGRAAALAFDAGAKPAELVHQAEDEAALKQLFKDYQIIQH